LEVVELKVGPVPKISGLVITLNEERHIRKCLESLSWVDEIIVVDSESRDQTVAIAKEFTELVYIRPWPGFPVQRNFGISKATGQWILVLDADERIPHEARQEILTWLESSEADDYAAALVPRKNFFFGKWIQYGGAYPDPQYRIFRKGKVRYDEATLDTPLVSGPIKNLTNPFDHLTGETVADRVRKISRETNYKARTLLERSARASWVDILFRPIVNFVKFYILKQGFRDGIEGYIQSGFASFHTFLRYAKYFEILRQRQNTNGPIKQMTSDSSGPGER
jgi:glycosyltransferase involved in cell wall biosynthesis